MKPKTVERALYDFWSSFGYPADNETEVLTSDDTANKFTEKRITYQSVTDALGHTAFLTGSIWDRNASGYSALSANSRKAAEIQKRLGNIGIKIDLEGGGALWIKAGHPFSQDMGDPGDDAVRRKVINIVVTFIKNV